MSQIFQFTPNRNQRRRGRAHGAPAGDRASQADLTDFLSQAALLEWLGRPPVAYNRTLVDITGGVNSAIWFTLALNHVANTVPGAIDAAGDCDITLKTADCQAWTGLSAAQQGRARADLAANGFISVVARDTGSAPAVFRIHLNRLAQALVMHSAPMADTLSHYGDLPGLPTGWARHA